MYLAGKDREIWSDDGARFPQVGQTSLTTSNVRF